MTDDQIKHLLAIGQTPHINQVHINLLMDYYDCPINAWQLCKEWPNVIHFDVNSTVYSDIMNFYEKAKVEKIYDYCNKLGVKIVTLRDDGYPQNVRNIDDPPFFFYYYGTLPEPTDTAITVVGSRKCSQYGLDCASKFAYDLARKGDVTIVSGLARGIDSAAHIGALKAKGKTIAVLATGIDRVYPPENSKLFEKIKEEGLIITEFPFGNKPLASIFPYRNRIMSGLSDAVLVCEANEKSGVSHTVDHALNQGRDVFVIPGCIDSFSSKGSNKMIQNGACLVTCVEDILVNYFEDNYLQDDDNHELDLSGYLVNERKLFEALKDNSLDMDQMMKISGYTASKLSVKITEWELDGIIKQLPGKLYTLCNIFLEEVDE